MSSYPSESIPAVSHATAHVALLDGCARDDLQARRVLQCAQGTLQKWPEGFPGFSAAIECRDGQHKVVGGARVFPNGRVEIDLAQSPVSAWARAALAAISLARTPRFFKDGDGQFPISFEPGNDHATGRAVRVHLGGKAFRVYRLDAKGRIRQAEHHHPSRHSTATYDGLVRACPGRVLPTRTLVLEWDVMTQSPPETAEIDDTYERHEHVWVPVCRRATVAHSGLRRELVLELTRHAWL